MWSLLLFVAGDPKLRGSKAAGIARNHHLRDAGEVVISDHGATQTRW
jgi:hypothetical protein